MTEPDEDSKNIKEGICRCCLSVGIYKDINAIFHWIGDKEVYNDMLKDCFNIELKAMPFHHNSTICELCILDLRSACNFKLKVLDSENNLYETCVNKKNFRKIDLNARNDTSTITMVSVDHTFSDDELYNNPFNDDGDDDFSDMDYIPLKSEKSSLNSKPQKKRRSIKVSTSKSKLEKSKTSLKLAKKREGKASVTTSMAKAKAKLEKIEKKKMASAAKLALLKTRAITANNSYTIIENSTASPFKWSCRNGYQCFYCATKYTDTIALRDHILTHKRDKLLKLLKKENVSLTKVDITNLKCRICTAHVEDLVSLGRHLTEEHGKVMAEGKEGLAQFRLTNEQSICCYCRKIFTSFQMLNAHLNCHFDNYVCETCGATFMSELRLTTHQRIHENGAHPCKYCSKTFPSIPTLSNHESKIHKKTVHKCHCGETFVHLYLKQRHRIEKHNETYLMRRCEECNLSFLSGTGYRGHLKRVHLKERKFGCEYCNSHFFTRHDLKKHTLKHTNEEKFQCVVCNKQYCQKKSLVEHMKVHTNDGYFCSQCGQTFAQSTSLKAHVAKHHVAMSNSYPVPNFFPL